MRHEDSLGVQFPARSRQAVRGSRAEPREATWLLAKRADLQCLVFRASVNALLFFRPTNVSSILPQGKAYYR